MIARALIVLTASASVVSQESWAQSTLHTFKGDSAEDYFGYAVAGAGDVNGDGVVDLIVGAAGDDNNGENSGNARVLSGADGSVIHSFDGLKPNNDFGASVSGAGDVNADGFADVIVGAPLNDKAGRHAGSARVFSGKNGKVLYHFNGDSKYDRFGFSVSGAGDVNRDGYADLIVGALYDDDNGPDSGSARVLSGFDGTVLYVFHGDSAGDHFGWSVGGAGDVNADGWADVVVGARYDDDNGDRSGSVRVFSGRDGGALYTFDGDASKDQLGWSVAGAGDVNGDGFADVIAGAPFDDNNGNWSGSARVFSGADGGILYTFDGDSAEDNFGWTVAGAGDVDGDGFDDLVVGAILDDDGGTNSGSASVFSGADGALLRFFVGDSGHDGMGKVAGAGDVNGDGYADLIIGSPGDSKNGKNAGKARVFSGCDDCVGDIGSSYCGPANLNSTGMSAHISAVGRVIAADDTVTLTASMMPRHQFGHFLASLTKGFVPFAGGSQGNLCLAGEIGRYVRPGELLGSGVGGTFSLRLDLTDTPQPTGSVAIQAGETWSFQAWFKDSAVNSSNFTDGLALTLR